MKKTLVLLICLVMVAGCSSKSQPLSKDDFFVFSDGRKVLSPEDDYTGTIFFSGEDNSMELETKRGLRIGDSVDKCKELYATLPCFMTKDGEDDAPDFNPTDYYYENIGEISVGSGAYDVNFLWGVKGDKSLVVKDLINTMTVERETAFDEAGVLGIKIEDGYVSDIHVMLFDNAE